MAKSTYIRDKSIQLCMCLHLVQHYILPTTVITLNRCSREFLYCSVSYNVPDYESFIETLLQCKEALIIA